MAQRRFFNRQMPRSRQVRNGPYSKRQEAEFHRRAQDHEEIVLAVA